LDRGDVYTFVNTGDADLCGRKYPVEWLPGDEATVWPGAVPIKSAGSATVNSQIWWENTQYHGAYSVRVYWDCVTVVGQCTRTITITNNLASSLANLMILMSWDFDISPTPRHEPAFFYGDTNYVSWATNNEARNSILNADGQIPFPLNTDSVRDQPYCDSIPNVVNTDTSPTGGPVPNWQQYCDSGATVVVPLGDISGGQSVSISIDFTLVDTIPELQNFFDTDPYIVFGYYADHADLTTDESGPWIAVKYSLVGPTKRALNYNLAVIPGDCPCVGNSTCAIGGIHLPCNCDSQHYGTFCELSCGEGTWDEVQQTCVCNPGWNKNNGQSCSTKCTCYRGSYCNPADGACYCKNGFTGSNCDKLHSCPRN